MKSRAWFPPVIAKKRSGLKQVVKPGVLLIPGYGCQATVNTQVISEANSKKHWRAEWDRGRKQHAAVASVLLCARGLEKKRVTRIHMIHLYARAPHRMDSDNLGNAFKHVRDAIAFYLTGIPRGRGDGDDRFTWVCDQRQSPEVGIEIGLYYGDDDGKV